MPIKPLPEDDEDGELVHMEPDGDEVVETDDGGAIVQMGDDTPNPDSEFYDNLALEMSSTDLKRLSADLIDLIEKDAEARKKRDEQYAEGIQRTGLGDEAPGGASFQGASKVVHPMLTEACVDFSSRIMKEIFPPNGPAKTLIVGEATAARTKKADRKTKLLNWQLTVQCPEARIEIKQATTQEPLGGVQYLKVNWDTPRNRPTFLFVAVDDMYLPYAATNFYSAHRKTHVQYITQMEYEQRVKEGIYRDVDLTPASMEPEQSVAGVSSDKIEGREQNSYNEDGLRTVWECHCQIDLGRYEKHSDGKGEDYGVSPYIVTIDKTTGLILSVYRNWAEDDESFTELAWFVEFPFLVWRGAYPIGLTHMIGGLSAAATGALRALLDSAFIQNTPAGVKLKGTVTGQVRSPNPGEIVEVEGGLAVDDVRKLFMPMPYNPPSATLFQLLGFIVEAGKGVVRTAMEETAEANTPVPVGTTLARIEQGMVVYREIHAQHHASMAVLLRILERLNGLHLDDEKLKKEAGEQLASRADFDGALDVVPVSDPNIFSEAQRFAQIQAVEQRATAMPGMYNLRRVEERILEIMNIPDWEELLMPAQEPREQNGVNENVAMSLGRPVTAFPEQDHLAHLHTHVAYMMHPTFGGNPAFMPVLMPGMVQHLKEHLALWYAATTFKLASQAIGEDLGDVMKEMKEERNEEERQELDRLLAISADAALKASDELVNELPPIIQQAQAMLQQLQGQQPMDPNEAAAKVAASQVEVAQANVQKSQIDVQKSQIELQGKQMEIGQKGQEAQLKGQELQVRAANDEKDLAIRGAELQSKTAKEAQDIEVKHIKLEQDALSKASDLQLARDKLQADAMNKAADRDAKMAMNAEDNQTAMTIASAEIASGEKVAQSTGTGNNPNPSGSPKPRSRTTPRKGPSE